MDQVEDLERLLDPLDVGAGLAGDRPCSMRPSLWLPRSTCMQPFSRVARSMATATESMSG